MQRSFPHPSLLLLVLAFFRCGSDYIILYIYLPYIVYHWTFDLSMFPRYLGLRTWISITTRPPCGHEPLNPVFFFRPSRPEARAYHTMPFSVLTHRTCGTYDNDTGDRLAVLSTECRRLRRRVCGTPRCNGMVSPTLNSSTLHKNPDGRRTPAILFT